MPWIMDAQSWKIIWGQSLMSRWVANRANSLRFPVPWKRACVLSFWFSFFWPCFPDLPSASGRSGYMMRGTSIMPGWSWLSIRSPELLYSWQYDTGHNFCKRPFFSSTVIQGTSSLSTEKSFPDVWSEPLPDVFYLSFHRQKVYTPCKVFLWWNGWLPRWLPPEIFSDKAWNTGKGWHTYWNSFDSSSLSISDAVWMIGLIGSSLNFCEAIAHLVKSRQMERKSESNRRLRSKYVVLQKPCNPRGG